METNNKKIEFLITGGTIDSSWNGSKDTVLTNNKSDIPEYFKKFVIYSNVDFTEICMKDSRELNESDRIKIVDFIKNSSSEKFIISHGTYTIPDTARYLKAHLTESTKTVVLVGSVVPLVGFVPTDAPFNLGFAFAKVQELSNGVYVCMNGETFTADEVAKDLTDGSFYSIIRGRMGNSAFNSETIKN